MTFGVSCTVVEPFDSLRGVYVVSLIELDFQILTIRSLWTYPAKVFDGIRWLHPKRPWSGPGSCEKARCIISSFPGNLIEIVISRQGYSNDTQVPGNCFRPGSRGIQAPE